MNTNMDHRSPITCPQCGTRSVGRFCSNCGSPLTDGESVTGEIQSKFTTPVTGLLSFLKTAWLVLVSPRVFYISYTTGAPPLSELTFPLAGVWRLMSASPQKVMRPFQCLATAIGLVAVIAALQNWAWRVIGFSERVFGKSMAEMAEDSERTLRAFYQEQFGKSLTIVDTAHLSGLAFIDAPVHEVIGLLQYMYFPLVVSIFLVGSSVRRSALMHFYVYAVSTSLALFFVFNAVGLIVFLALQAWWVNAALGLSELSVIVGYAARVYFVAVLPVVVLPHILPVTRGRMVAATLIGAAIWMAANWMLTQLLVFKLGVVWI